MTAPPIWTPAEEPGQAIAARRRPDDPAPLDDEGRARFDAELARLDAAESADDGAEHVLADVLDLVVAELRRFVVWPSEEAADAVALWVAATHAQPVWEHASRLVLKSPVKRCGKTRAAEVVRELAAKPLVAGSISAAALVRTIDGTDPPTLVLDEADTIFGRRAETEAGEALRQILNLGHSRGWPYLRWDVKSKSLETCPTFAMALIAGIGDLPDTIEDRAIVVVMQRRAPGEVVASFRQSNVPALTGLRNLLSLAIRGAFHGGYSPPPLPVDDRAADVWEPLVAVADAAGGEWPDRARRACLALVRGDDDEPGLAQKLLADLRAIWGDDERHLPTAVILERLACLDESPWADYFGRSLTPRDLARLLKPFGVKSKPIRMPGGSVPRGYSRDDLWSSWAKYTHEPEEALQALRPLQASDEALQVQEPLQRNPATVRDVTEVAHVAEIRRRALGVAEDEQSSATASATDDDRCRCGEVVFAFTPEGEPLCEAHVAEFAAQDGGDA